MNVGISKAQSFDKRWIILSNDDVSPISPIAKLAEEINSRRGGDWFRPLISTGKRSLASSWVISRLPERGLISKIWDFKSHDKAESASTYYLIKRYCERFTIDPFVAVQCTPFQSWTDRLVSTKRIRRINPFLNCQPFAVFRSEILRDLLFDEDYVNACEDMDFSMRLAFNGHAGVQIDYALETKGGASFGQTRTRWLRYGLSGRLLFAAKSRRLLNEITMSSS
jgi:hypothetical protein